MKTLQKITDIKNMKDRNQFLFLMYYFSLFVFHIFLLIINHITNNNENNITFTTLKWY
jgi:hypothetical protein